MVPGGDRHHHAAGRVPRGPADPAALAREVLAMPQPRLRAEDLHRVGACRPARARLTSRLRARLGQAAGDDLIPAAAAARRYGVADRTAREFTAHANAQLADLSEHARDTASFVHLQFALNFLARAHLLAGELAAAAELLDEDQLIALCADWRVVAPKRPVRGTQPAVGVPLTDGGTQRLPRIVGYGNTTWLISTGCRIDAERAFQIGSSGNWSARHGHAPSSSPTPLPNYPTPHCSQTATSWSRAPGQPLHAGLDTEARAGRTAMANPDVIQRLTANAHA